MEAPLRTSLLAFVREIVMEMVIVRLGLYVNNAREMSRFPDASVLQQLVRTTADLLRLPLQLLQDLNQPMLPTHLARHLYLEICLCLVMEANSCFLREWIANFSLLQDNMCSTTTVGRVQFPCTEEQTEQLSSLILMMADGTTQAIQRTAVVAEEWARCVSMRKEK
jgi:hypothetical protein